MQEEKNVDFLHHAKTQASNFHWKWKIKKVLPEGGRYIWIFE